MNHSRFFALLSAALILIPLVSEAGVNKCTDSAGVVSYLDQPCSTKEGLKPAEIKNGSALATNGGREIQNKIAQTCIQLSEKKRSCYSSIESHLNEAFDTNCEVPMKRAILEKQLEQTERYRKGRYNPGYREQYEERLEQLEAKMSCNEIQTAMWDFVRESFGTKLTAKDIKAIEYNLYAVPGGNNDSLNTPYRSRRR